MAKLIKPDECFVVVPSGDVDRFRRVSPEAFHVIDEDLMIPGLRAKIADMTPPGLEWRVGWYLQQFLKLSLLKQATNSDYSIIWDSDTLPLRRIKVRFSRGRLELFGGNEFHRPYFQQIHRLTGLEKSVSRSFIAQNIILKTTWVNEFFEFISSMNDTKVPWIDKVLNSIDFSEKSGFSEYELLGTWLSHAHRNDFTFSDKHWSRNGTALAWSARVARLLPVRAFLAVRYHYISFENWEQRNISFPGSARLSRAIEGLGRVARRLKCCQRNAQ